MTRRFANKGGSELQLSAGSAIGNFTGACTYVALVFPTAAGARVYERYFSSGGGTQAQLLLDASGKLRLVHGGSNTFSKVPLFNLEEWMLVAAVYPGGAEAVPIFYSYGFTSGEFKSSEGEANVKAAVTGTPGLHKIGSQALGENPNSGFAGDLAAVAAYSSALSESAIKSLKDAATLEEWMTLTTPACFWTFGQNELAQTVRDWTGNGANESFRTGTTLAEVSPSIYYSAREQITWALTDDLMNAARTEEEWPKLAWANTRGTFGASSIGWQAGGFSASFLSRSGAYYAKGGKLTGNAFVALARPTSFSLVNTAGQERSFSVWLQTSGAGTGNGYRLRLLQKSNGSGAPNRFQFDLAKYVEGARTTLEETGEVTIEIGGAFALAKVAGKLIMFRRETETSEWVQVGTEHEDLTFGEGYAGIDGNGSNPVLSSFKTGALEGPAEPGGGGGAVKVLKNGVLVEAKRWVLKNGVLVEA